MEEVDVAAKFRKSGNECQHLGENGSVAGVSAALCRPAELGGHGNDLM